MKKILMIGDSITEGFNVKLYLPDISVINYGVSGDSTVETLERIDKSWFIDNPDKIFLCIGTNDFARERSNEYILDNINQIIDKISSFSPGTKIVPVSIFPTKNNPLRSNERIKRFNSQLEELVKSRKLYFFNIYNHFKDENGELKGEFTEDGLHLTSKAYRLWAELILNFL